MCKIEAGQDAIKDGILSVGQKIGVRGHGMGTIIGIRVWYFGGLRPVFDVQGNGWSYMNLGFEELEIVPREKEKVWLMESGAKPLPSDLGSGAKP